MEKGLVSIISPCYNREKILWRFLDSVLSQTYKNIQLILVDDGSTDNTFKVMQDYSAKFESAGIRYEYYTKQNGGVSSAINEGLRYVKGEFLCWPDSDDWYEPEAVKKRVDFLNKHPEYAIVSCDATGVFERENRNVTIFASGKAKERFEENQFWLMLKGKSMVCCICHMVRTQAFWNAHPDKKIYDSRHGQNIQMLLPIYYYYKRGFIDEVLCHYLIVEGSLSRSDDTFEKKLAYRDSIEKLTIETIKSIRMSKKERGKYLKYAMVKNTRKRLILAGYFHKKEFAKRQIKRLMELKAVRLKDIITYLKS